jgi:hypothetical protein
MSWFYASAGVQNGPVSEEELRALGASGRLQPMDLVWSSGMSGWQPASSIPGLLPARPAAPPPFPPAPSAQPVPQQYPQQAPYPPPQLRADDPAMRWILPVGRSGWAIAAGYLGIFSLLGIFAPFAVITGILGLREIKKDPRLGGRGRAIFGIVMGGIFTLFNAALIIMLMLNR